MTADVRIWPPTELRGVEFHPMMAELLGEEQAARVVLSPGSVPAWVFTRYDEVKAVTADPRFSREAAWEAGDGRAGGFTRERALLEGDLTFQDGEAHARMRRQLARALSPARTAALGRTAARVCDALMDAVVAKGPPADLVEDLASPFALEMAYEIVGVPGKDRDRRLCAHYETVFSVAAGPDEAREARDALRMFFRRLVSEARQGPAGHGSPSRSGSLLAVLAQPDSEMTDQQVVATVYHVAQAAWHGIRNHGGNLLYMLLSRNSDADWLRQHPQARPVAVDELLRYLPRLSTLGVERVATEDVVVGGATVRRGEAVYVSYASANRDSRVFPEPDRIELRGRGTPHLAYGHGPHRCPAASLVNVELLSLMGALLDRLPTARLAVPQDQLLWRTKDILRGPQQLPVIW
ncbi:cytochrome P450 [Streptomyces sp. NPDC101455]|uniref:cytochrome P450 n=1 Tax=Streptomyces sp. NPDC101455 TaxID=3366142 RepID=UPI0037F76647